jgi:hypothetical protein
MPEPQQSDWFSQNAPPKVPQAKPAGDWFDQNSPQAGPDPLTQQTQAAARGAGESQKATMPVLPTPEPTGIVSRVAQGAASGASAMVPKLEDMNPFTTENLKRAALGAPGMVAEGVMGAADEYQKARGEGQPRSTSALAAATKPLGIDTEGIRERAKQGDIAGLAGEAVPAVAATVLAPEIEKRAAPTLERLTAGPRASAATKAIARSTSDLEMVTPSTRHNPITPDERSIARMYVEKQHGIKPITTQQGIVDAADSAIGEMDKKVKSYIDVAPNDPITSKPLEDVQNGLAANAAGDSTYVKNGMKEIDRFNLGEVKTVKQADTIRARLNAENQGILKKNNYDRATARASDPGFAAREIAAKSLRDGTYDALEQRGTTGVKELRQHEGAVIKFRNAAEAELPRADQVVGATKKLGTAQKVGRTAARVAGAAGGAALGGPLGAGAGSIVAGDIADRAIGSEGLTRDQLAERAFKVKTSDFIGYPKTNLRAIPEKQVPSGTQLPLTEHPLPGPTEPPNPANPQQPNLFDTSVVKPRGEDVGARPLRAGMRRGETEAIQLHTTPGQTPRENGPNAPPIDADFRDIIREMPSSGKTIITPRPAVEPLNEPQQIGEGTPPPTLKRLTGADRKALPPARQIQVGPSSEPAPEKQKPPTLKKKKKP